MSRFFLRDRGPVAALLLLCAALLLPGLAMRDFWEPEEPEFALIIRTMAERGDWIVPWQNGAWYSEKPPLLYWASLLTTLGGATFDAAPVLERTLARLPSAIAATALVLGLYAFTRGPWGRRAAFLAAACLATCGEFAWRGMTLQTDALFAAATAGSVMAFLAADRHEGPRPRASLLLLGWMLLAAAVLAKGPLGLVLAGAALLAHLALAGAARARRALATPVHAAGLLLFIAIVVPWYLVVRDRLGPVEGDAFLHGNLVVQNLDRTADAWSHRQPPWYYLRTLPLSLLPWTPVVIVAMVAALRAAWRDRDGAGRLVAAWFIPGFVLLSFVSSKQGKYLLPLFPPLALAAGVWIDRVAAAHPLRTASRVSLSTTAGVLLLAGLALAAAPLLPLSIPAAMAGVQAAAVPGGLVLALGATVALVRLRLHADAARAAVDVAITAALGGAVLLVAVLPIVDAGKSARPFCREVDRLVGPGAAIAQYGTFRSQYTYFLHRDTAAFTVSTPEGTDRSDEEVRLARRASIAEAGRGLREFLAAPGRGYVVTRIVYAERFMDADTRALLDPTPLLRRFIGDDEVVLLSER